MRQALLPKKIRKPERLARLRRGASLVEFAMVAPILFLILTAFVEFDRYIVSLHALEEASRVGCRLAVLQNTTKEEVEDGVDDLLEHFGINDYALTTRLVE